jgi:O-antigen ligase
MTIALSGGGSGPAIMERAAAGTGFLARTLHGLLAWIFFFETFIGRSPFADPTVASRVEGSGLDRIVMLSLAGLAVLVLALHWRALPSLIRRSAGIWVIAGVAVLSLFWSDYPDLTIRRSILLVCQTLIAAGVAIGIRDLRRAFVLFCYAISAVALLNVLSIFALPSRAMTDIGAKGLYSHKNVAGMVAMAAVIANLSLLCLGRLNFGRTLLGLAMLLVSFAFLILTESKTSLGLAALAGLLLVGLMVTDRGGPIMTLAATLLALCLAGALTVVLAIFDFNIAAVLPLVLEDTSFTGRDELWAFVIRVVQERFWLGHGYGAFWDVGIGADPLLRIDPGSWLGDVETGIINQAHNGYLELWLHIGLPATILATGIVLMALCKALYFYAASTQASGSRAAFAFLATMLLVYILHNLTEASLFMRGIFLFNVMLPMLFLVARGRAFTGRHSAS